jgi:general nucleoside transport system permease protein
MDDGGNRMSTSQAASSWLDSLPMLKLKQAKSMPGFAAVFSVVLFAALSSLFFLLLGREPFGLLWQVIQGAFGDWYSFSETLVKTAPILLCALATALPARLGLLSVGAMGQFYGGAILGTWVVLNATTWPSYVLLPAMLIGGFIGGGLIGGIAGFLRARYKVNETLVTLLLNYVLALLVDYCVYGPWRDTTNLGWPATPAFPDAARLPTLFDTRCHVGLLIGIGLAVLLHVSLTGTRWGLMLRVMRGHEKVALWSGLNAPNTAWLLIVLGGGLAGLAGISETSAIQGRLQSGIAANYGLTGFLVAWMSQQHFLKIMPYSLAMGALLAASDALQLFAELPAASAVVLQVLLFFAVFVSDRLFPATPRASKPSTGK